MTQWIVLAGSLPFNWGRLAAEKGWVRWQMKLDIIVRCPPRPMFFPNWYMCSWRVFESIIYWPLREKSPLMKKKLRINLYLSFILRVTLSILKLLRSLKGFMSIFAKVKRLQFNSFEKISLEKNVNI